MRKSYQIVPKDRDPETGFSELYGGDRYIGPVCLEFLEWLGLTLESRATLVADTSLSREPSRYTPSREQSFAFSD